MAQVEETTRTEQAEETTRTEQAEETTRTEQAQETTRTEQAEETRGRRDELVDAAARLFSERGYHGTSMRDLGDSLGLLRGSLYAHINSKQELLFDVVDRGAERFLSRAREAEASGAPAGERLRRLLVGHVETAIEHLEAGTVFLNEWRYLSDDLRDLIRDKRDRYEAIVRRIISDGMEAGEFRRDLDVALAARLALSGGNWVYSWYRPEGRLSPTEIGSEFADMLTKGMHNKEAS